MRIYFDSDGVLAKWNDKASFEEVCSPQYFLEREADPYIVELSKSLWLKGDTVGIITSVPNIHSITDKNKWFSKFVPFISKRNIVYVPYGEDKKNYIDFPEKAVLVDDYTKNLNAWDGKAVKYYNGINGKNGTWRGLSISSSIPIEASISLLEGGFYE